jgi:hypothetical protein
LAKGKTKELDPSVNVLCLYVNGLDGVLKKAKPLRLLSSHFDCLVRTWLAHHHEEALLAARCNILFLPPAQEYFSQVIRASLLCMFTFSA